MKTSAVTCFFAVVLGGAIACAQTRDELMVSLQSAVEAFDHASALLRSDPDGASDAFRDARDQFQSVINTGVENGRLYYNLGNTHVRLGELGHAIAAYRRAERLIPADEQLKTNLRFARSLTRDHIQPDGKRALLHTLFFWHYSLPARTRLTAGLIAYGVFWMLLAVRTFRPKLSLGYPVVVAIVVWMSIGVSLGVERASRGQNAEGVLVVSDVVVRKGDGEGYDPQFRQPLHQGVEFTLLADRGGWVHIELPDGNTGWVRRAAVELF